MLLFINSQFFLNVPKGVNNVTNYITKKKSDKLCLLLDLQQKVGLRIPQQN